MPSNDKKHAVLRQWAIIRCLSVRHQTTQQIHQRLLTDFDIDVAENTVLRDLKMLSEAGLAIDRTESKPICWKLKKEWAEKLGAMSEAEALMIVLADQYVQQALPITFGQAMHEVLELARQNLNARQQHGLPGNKHARWLDKVRVVPTHQFLIPPEFDPGIHHTLVSALLNDQPVRARYRGFDMRKLSPLALIVRGGVLYLAATRDDEATVKHFALHRFESAETLYGEPLNVPEDFDIGRLIKSGWADFLHKDEGDIRLEIWCRQELKNHLWEMKLAENQWITPQPVAEDWYAVTATLPLTWQLRGWLLSQGHKVQVREPASLRKELHQELTQALQGYESHPTGSVD